MDRNGLADEPLHAGRSTRIHAPDRRLDRAFAALDELPAGGLVHCLHRSAGHHEAPTALVGRLPQARWVHSDDHPLTSIDPSDHLRVHQAWVEACEGLDRVGRVRVRTTRPLLDADDREIGPVGMFAVNVIDLTGIAGIDAVVITLVPAGTTEVDPVEDPGELTATPSWFRGTTSFRLRLDARGRIGGGTLNVAEVLGVALVDLLGQAVQDLVHPDDLPAGRQEWDALLSGERHTVHTRARLAMTDGSWRWFDVTSWNVLDVPKFGAVIAEYRDVQDQVVAEEAQLATTRDLDRLIRVFDEVDDMVMVTRLAAGLVYVNQAAATLLPPDPLGKPLVDQVRPELRRFVTDEVLPGIGRLERWTGDVDLTIGGELRTMATTVTPVSEPGQDEIYVAVIMRDVTSERSHARVLSRQARLDPLTGLPNRLALMEQLDATRATGDPSGLVAVSFIDLDNLKIVNDGLGHSAGDRLLRAVGAQLLTVPNGIVARFGGDEFVVVHTDQEPEAVVAAAEQVLAAIRRVHVVGVASHVTASVGVASCRRDLLDPEAIIRDADAAMYVAKRSGRARVVRFDDQMRNTVTRRFELETALRRDLADGRLEVHLQPVIALADDSLGGFEALARWTAASPTEFIPIAEDSGLIVPLGRWALHESLSAQRRLSALGTSPPGLRIGVNVSGNQLLDPAFPAMVLAALDEFEVDPAVLVLELTESVLIDPHEDIDAVLRGLRDAGITLALDDFGSGYSSLGNLRRYPIDVLKLDTSYTQALLHDEGTRIIAEAMVTMAHRLGLRVVAEGVETDDQLAVVRELGIDWAQGFLLGRPAPVDEVAARLSGG